MSTDGHGWDTHAQRQWECQRAATAAKDTRRKAARLAHPPGFLVMIGSMFLAGAIIGAMVSPATGLVVLVAAVVFFAFATRPILTIGLAVFVCSLTCLLILLVS